MGGKFHLKLNIGSRPIANKYHEGKVKRTLKRELKVPEIAEREANGTSVSWSDRKSTRLELQSHSDLVCRLLLEKKKKTKEKKHKKQNTKPNDIR